MGAQAQHWFETSAAPTGAGALAVEGFFVCNGEFWTVQMGGPVAHIRDTKGCRQIHHLLSHPGERTSCVDLLNLGRRFSSPVVAAPTPRLDTAATAEYRRRLSGLEEQLAEAESQGEVARAVRLREEREWLQKELASALGLRGRARKGSPEMENARVAVTRTIRAVVRRVRAIDPELGRHLDLAIKTGYDCVYVPDPGRPVTWQL